MSTIREPRPRPQDAPTQEAAMSREGKWTPGPWTVRDTGRVWSVHSSSTHRPLVTIDRDMGNSIAEANARLIAAAPQMAEALRDVLREYETSAGKRGTYDGDHKISGYALGNVRAALRAAGGE